MKLLPLSMMLIAGLGADMFAESVAVPKAKPRAAIVDLDFDSAEKGKVKDLSGHGNDFVSYDNEISPEFVKTDVGNSLYLSGKGGWLRGKNNSSFNNLEQLSIEAWINPKLSGGTPHIIGKAASWIFRLVNDKVCVVVCADPFAQGELQTRGKLLPNQWNHVAATYDGKFLKIYLNGRLERATEFSGKLASNNSDVLIGINGFSTDNYYRGYIRSVRVFDRALTDEEVTKSFLAPRYEKVREGQVLFGRARQTVKAVNVALIRLKTEQLMADSLSHAEQIAKLEQLSARAKLAKTLHELQEVETELMKLPSLSANEKEDGGSEALAIFTPETHAIRTDLVRSDIDPQKQGMVPTSNINVLGCPGEFEAASLIFYAKDDVSDITLEWSDLNAAEAVIPSSAIDSRIVLPVLNRTDFGKSDFVGEVDTVQDLLVYDDSLFKVNKEQKTQWVKVSKGDSTEYLKTEDIKYNAGAGHAFVEDLNFNDAKTLQPFAIAKGENKQLWFTFHIPHRQPAGLYRGSLKIKSKGVPVGEVSLSLRVLPFDLKSPITNYDSEKPFTPSVYYWGHYDPEAKPTVGSPLKTREQSLIEFKNMKDHGVEWPVFIWANTMLRNEPGVMKANMKLAQEGGFSQTLALGESGFLGTDSSPEALAEVKQRCKFVIDNAAKYGFDTVYFYGLDESYGQDLLDQVKPFRVCQAAGGKTLVSGFNQNIDVLGEALDLFNWCGVPDKDEAERWHKIGKRIFNYYYYEVGFPDTLAYRRNFGLFLWLQNYDGVLPYLYNDVHHGQWMDPKVLTQGYLGFVKNTATGVLDTLSWEAYREAIDDIKYASTLKLLAGADNEKVASFLANLDVDDDPQLLRLNIIDHVINLPKK